VEDPVLLNGSLVAPDTDHALLINWFVEPDHAHISVALAK
jgi:hypothetical protein